MCDLVVKAYILLKKWCASNNSVGNQDIMLKDNKLRILSWRGFLQLSTFNSLNEGLIYICKSLLRFSCPLPYFKILTLEKENSINTRGCQLFGNTDPFKIELSSPSSAKAVLERPEHLFSINTCVSHLSWGDDLGSISPILKSRKLSKSFNIILKWLYKTKRQGSLSSWYPSILLLSRICRVTSKQLLFYPVSLFTLAYCSQASIPMSSVGFWEKWQGDREGVK